MGALQVRVDPELMAMKQYYTLPRSQELKFHHQMQFSVISRTLYLEGMEGRSYLFAGHSIWRGWRAGVLSLCRTLYLEGMEGGGLISLQYTQFGGDGGGVLSLCRTLNSEGMEGGLISLQDTQFGGDRGGVLISLLYSKPRQLKILFRIDQGDCKGEFTLRIHIAIWKNCWTGELIWILKTFHGMLGNRKTLCLFKYLRVIFCMCVCVCVCETIRPSVGYMVPE